MSVNVINEITCTPCMSVNVINETTCTPCMSVNVINEITCTPCMSVNVINEITCTSCMSVNVINEITCTPCMSVNVINEITCTSCMSVNVINETTYTPCMSVNVVNEITRTLRLTSSRQQTRYRAKIHPPCVYVNKTDGLKQGERSRRHTGTVSSRVSDDAMYVLTGNQASWTPTSSHRQKMAVFTQSDCFRLKLLRVLETAGQKVMTYTLLCGTPGKNPSETLIEYLARLPDTSTAKYKNMTTRQKRNCFDRDQKQMIIIDPSCSSFDITLLFKAITVACEGLDDTTDLARLVKKIKDTRNVLVHDVHKTATQHVFLTELKKLQEDFDETLQATKEKYNTDGVECVEKKNEVTQLVHAIRDEKIGNAEIRNFSYEYLPHFQREANEELKQKIDHAKHFNPLSFLSGHEDREVNVKTIFTEIKIQEENKENENIHYLELLTLAQNKSAPSKPHLLLLEGEAGSGKTTLVTYIVSDYLEGNRRMAGLDHYHLLLWVVCREETSDTLEKLVKRLLPYASSKYGYLLMPLLKLSKVIIIIDGLDEMMETSRPLLDDILNQAKDCPDFTLLSTSRPEAIQRMKSKSKNFKLSHLKLEGVSVDMRTEMALVHYRWLCGAGSRDEDGLRKVMQQMGWKQMFNLPLNILFLVTFIYYEPNKLESTITQTELYQEIINWCVEKLKETLLRRHSHLTEHLLQINIGNFLKQCYEIALKGLIQDKIYLDDEDRNKLEEFSSKNNLPIEDVLPAFYSMRRQSVRGVTKPHYFAPHKGLQDFFAACHIHGCFSNNYNPGDIRKELHKMAGQNLQLGPLRNMICNLLGLLSRRSPSVKAVEETVDLLQKSGMEDTNDWLSVLADTEPDIDTMLRVAQHIDENRDNDNEYVTNEVIRVIDGTVNIAAALLPVIRRRKVTIDLTRDQSGMEDLGAALNDHKLTDLILRHHFKLPRPDTSSAPLLQQAPSRDLRWFRGQLDADHLRLLPRGLVWLYLSVAGDSHAKTLLPALRRIRGKCPHLYNLWLHVPVSQVTVACLSPLPDDVPDVRLYLSGVGDVQAAVAVAAALCPEQEGYVFIRFPGATLRADGWKAVLRGLKDRGVRVRGGSVDVLDTTITADEGKQLDDLATYLLGCDFGRLSEEKLWRL
ncbi:uncharacterized protein LOC126994917 [Eriocheir sinensis]|uniref:uncharacterized protein LOC126994917 n=1 Tax=Eriocheir sinensis TaxID=95602 RepID=UPI0021C8D6EE|nr:uncharacterized protein LOC126994917 [Eriocheir sinensis]